jgi:hypothetical protein
VEEWRNGGRGIHVVDVLYKVEKAHKGGHSIKRIVDVHCLFDPFRSLLPQLWCVSTCTFDLTMQCRFGWVVSITPRSFPDNLMN